MKCRETSNQILPQGIKRSADREKGKRHFCLILFIFPANDLQGRVKISLMNPK